MNIFQLKNFSFQASEVSSGTIQNNEFSALLDLVIPTSDVPLPPIEMTLLNNSCNPIDYPSPCVMPQSSALPLPTHQEPIDSKFCTNSPSLNELVISHNMQLPASNPALIKPGPRWLKPMSVIRPDPTEMPLTLPLEVLLALPLPYKVKNNRSKKCQVAGCNTKKQSNGRCIRHGGGKRCVVEGCTRGAQTMGRCKRHGGGARCTIAGCTSSSQGGGLCRTHGGGKLCTAPGCWKGAQRQGKCATHASRKCSVHDCSSIARCQGFCRRHKQTEAAEHQLRPAKRAKQLEFLV